MANCKTGKLILRILATGMTFKILMNWKVTDSKHKKISLNLNGFGVVTFFMTLQDKDSKIKNCETLTIEQ
jgi:hypothetical protein